jgi:hypothetical protein
MAHDLYTQVGYTVGMRRAAAAMVATRITDQFLGRHQSVLLEQGCITVRIWLPWKAWLLLGLWHLLVWAEARRLTAEVLWELGVALSYRVEVRSGKPNAAEMARRRAQRKGR